MTSIMLREEEKEALRRSTKYLKERGEALFYGKMKLDAIILENLLARAGGEQALAAFDAYRKQEGEQ